jgi:hypothetical protein
MMSVHDPEFKHRFSGRYFGKYRALVTNTDDPRQLLRIMVKVPAVFGVDEELGWAWPSPAAGGSENNGEVIPVARDDLVWVEFEEGDPERPVWCPGPWPIRGGESTFPYHARGLADDVDYSVRDYGNIPPSSFNGAYNSVRFIRDKAGNVLELDGTPGSERVQLSHVSGARLEMLKDGSVQAVSNAAWRSRVEGNKDIEIGGSIYKAVAGSEEASITGSSSVSYGRERSEVYSQRSVVGGRVSQEWRGGMSFKSNGQASMRTASNLILQSANQMQVMSGADLVGTVMELFDLTVSAATKGGLGTVASNIHAYNGINQLRATDPTGLALDLRLQLDPVSPMPKIHLQAGEGGSLDLLTSPGVGNVFLGGYPSAESVLKGTSFMGQLQAVMTGLTALASGLSAIPLTASVGSALQTVMTAWTANSAANGNWLSTKVFTQ